MPAMVSPRKASRERRRSRGDAVAGLRGGAVASVTSHPETAKPRNRATSSSQLPIRIQMPQRPRLVPTPLQNSGEVVVRVGIRRIERHRAAIGFRRLVQTSQILEGDAEIEPGDVVIGIGLQRGAVLLLGGSGSAVLVQKAAEVHARVGM